MKQVLIFLLLSFLSRAAVSHGVLTYGPKVVSLDGRLDLQTFPGPPNYESIHDGDEIERHFYLRLDEPIDVIPRKENKGIENAEEERNVKIVQLAIDEENAKLWAKLHKLGRGARVTITGTLFHRFTGHHHSRILLSVDDLKVRKK